MKRHSRTLLTPLVIRTEACAPVGTPEPRGASQRRSHQVDCLVPAPQDPCVAGDGLCLSRPLLRSVAELAPSTLTIPARAVLGVRHLLRPTSCLLHGIAGTTSSHNEKDTDEGY